MSQKFTHCWMTCTVTIDWQFVLNVFLRFETYSSQISNPAPAFNVRFVESHVQHKISWTQVFCRMWKHFLNAFYVSFKGDSCIVFDAGETFNEYLTAQRAMAIINLEMSPNCVDVRFNLPLCTNVIFKTITITNLKNENFIMIWGFLRKPICGYVRGPFGPKPQIKQTGTMLSYNWLLMIYSIFVLLKFHPRGITRYSCVIIHKLTLMKWIF